MNRRTSTVLIGSIIIGIAVMLAIYMGLIVTGVIDTRPSSLVVVADSAQKEYDGKPLRCETFTLKKGALKKGHKLEVFFGTEQTEVGWTENVITVKVRDAIGADVTDHYDIETRPGKLTVNPRRLIVKSGDTQKEYDGTPLTYEMWDLVLGELPEGFDARATFSGVQTVPGTSENSFALTVLDQHGRPAGRSFEISYIFGQLTVTKRALLITSYGASKVYDGEPLRYESYTLEGEVLEDHFLEVSFPESVKDVGEVTNNVAVRIFQIFPDGSMGSDVTGYYEISRKVGTLKVLPRPIEISATPCIKHFSGDELPQGKYFITKGTLLDGHELFADVEAELNFEGTVEFMLRNVHIADSNKSWNQDPDVTDCYEITLVHGIDRDHLETLLFASGSKSGPYTGEPLTNEQYVLVSGVLDPGHEVVPHFTGSQTEIGFSDNTFTVSIIDRVSGEDVTYRYEVSYEYGTLEVYETAPSTGGEISDDGSLDNDVQNTDATAARIWAQSSGRVYLRWKSYGNYDFRENTGNWGWGEAMAYPLSDENMLYTVGQMLAEDGKVPTLYQIELLGNQYLLPNYVAQGEGGTTNDVYLSPYAKSYTLFGYDWSYSYFDALRYMAMGAGDEAKMQYTEFVQGQYLAVPESTKQALLAFAEQNGLRVNRPGVIEDVAELVRDSAKYDLDYPACPAGQDEVVYFLTESGRGVCRHFASAATLLYRSLGIPARYVVGYSTYAEAEVWTDVKGADAHAWVEVYIPGLGWVRIDPTPALSGTSDDALVLMPATIKGYYTGEPYEITPDKVYVAQGKLKAGHKLANVTVSGSQTDVGICASYVIRAQILDENGNDVTDTYTVVYQKGTIEVKAPTLTVTTAQAKKVYDGTPLRAPTFTCTYLNTAPGASYTVTAEVTGEQCEIGQSRNTIENVVITDEEGNDVTHNFAVTVQYGELKVYLYELEISSSGGQKEYDGTPLSSPELDFDRATLTARGHELVYTMPSVTDVGAVSNIPINPRIVDADGNDVTKQYDLQYSAGVLRITPIKLVVVTDSAEKVYDGSALYAQGYTLRDGELADGQRIKSYHITGSQTNVGVSDAYVTDIVIVDAQGRNVTANYQITIIKGTLHVMAP